MELIKIVQAAGESAVTCSGGNCSVCGIIETVSKIYNFLTGLSFAVAVLFLALAGLVFIFGTGRRSYFQKAKIFAKNAIIGFIFVLVGWMAIHAVLFSTGFKNAGNWWQFECATEYPTVSFKSLNSYANIADFIASRNTQGVIKKPVSDAVFLNLMKNLSAGEKLTFYLPAKNNKTQEDVLVPFLAGYKDANGNINIDSLQAQLLTNLVDLTSGGSKDSNDSVSFVDALGKMLSPAQSASLVDKLFEGLFGIDSSGLSLDEKIEYASNYIIDFQEQNPVTSSSSTIEKVMNRMMTKALEDTAIVAQKTTDGSGGSKTSQDDSGDRSETKGGYDPNKWQNTQNQQKKQTNTLPPGAHSDDWSDLIDQNKDKQKPEGETSLCDDDWNEGDGTKMAILKGLRRLYKRDRLRYEMMFRFVDEIKDHPKGGECTGCGKIKVTHKAKIIDIAHMLVHEGTHSGQFCLNLMGPYEAQGIGEKQPGRGKIEAIACANAMGSIEKNKGHRNMDEFTKGEDGKAIENLPKVTLGAGSGQGGTGQIRGNLARYWTEVNPRGDLDTGMLGGLYDFMTKYPPDQGLPSNYYPAGQYHYGICEGQPKYLTLQDPEEEVVKKIVTSKEKCKSSPPKDILPPCKPGSGGEDGKPAPLPQIEACKGAPEMNIQ